MIGRITGILTAKQPPQVLVDCNGVGYEIDVPMSTFYNLPALGEKISLLTHLAIREDAHLLYGFGSEIERAAFRELLKVSGIGAKTALSVLSGLSVNDLSAAIAAQEIGRIVKVPGIGKKTAERLLLELKGQAGVCRCDLRGGGRGQGVRRCTPGFAGTGLQRQGNRRCHAEAGGRPAGVRCDPAGAEAAVKSVKRLTAPVGQRLEDTQYG
jgi:Holliday junction DNA helicase RuvA subunit